MIITMVVSITAFSGVTEMSLVVISWLVFWSPKAVWALCLTHAPGLNLAQFLYCGLSTVSARASETPSSKAMVTQTNRERFRGRIVRSFQRGSVKYDVIGVDEWMIERYRRCGCRVNRRN